MGREHGVVIDVTGVVLAAAEGVDEDLGQALEGLTAGDWVTAGAVLVLAVGLSGLLQRLTAGLLSRGDGEAGASQFVGRVVASLDVRMAGDGEHGECGSDGERGDGEGST